MFVGERLGFLSNVVSTTKAKKLLSKSCEAYLTYVLNSRTKDLRVQAIRTMRDFLDVFPDELPSLSLDREVEFGIKVYPNTILVSIALYCMAPKEFKS